MPEDLAVSLTKVTSRRLAKQLREAADTLDEARDWQLFRAKACRYVGDLPQHHGRAVTDGRRLALMHEDRAAALEAEAGSLRAWAELMDEA